MSAALERAIQAYSDKLLGLNVRPRTVLAVATDIRNAAEVMSMQEVAEMARRLIEAAGTRREVT